MQQVPQDRAVWTGRLSLECSISFLGGGIEGFSTPIAYYPDPTRYRGVELSAIEANHGLNESCGYGEDVRGRGRGLPEVRPSIRRLNRR
jgi:hypothetical protein